MLQENLMKIYETSFRDNREMPALTDYFKGETFSYYEMAKEVAKLHLLFKKAGIRQGDKIALIGRNNPRWCITYIATITYGAVIVPILQDFTPADIIHIINHSESRLLFLGDNFWDDDRGGPDPADRSRLLADGLPCHLRARRQVAHQVPARHREELPHRNIRADSA